MRCTIHWTGNNGRMTPSMLITSTSQINLPLQCHHKHPMDRTGRTCSHSNHMEGCLKMHRLIISLNQGMEDITTTMMLWEEDSRNTAVATTIKWRWTITWFIMTNTWVTMHHQCQTITTSATIQMCQTNTQIHNTTINIQPIKGHQINNSWINWSQATPQKSLRSFKRCLILV